MLQTRSRKIVRQASSLVKNPSTKAWLRDDERGTWEALAAELLTRTADKARELRLTEERVDEEIAAELGYRALNATLEHARQRPAAAGRRRRR